MLRDKLKACGANFCDSCFGGAVRDFGDVAKELSYIRNSAAVCDFSFLPKYSLNEECGAEFLDSVLPANMLKLRYGKMADTFLASPGGEVLAEVLAVNIDGRIFLLAESARADADFSGIFNGEGTDFKDITKDYCVLSFDGPSSWRLAESVFGTDALNLSYMSVEMYEFGGEPVCLMRGGKTGEFGYQAMIESRKAGELFDCLKEGAENLGGGLAGMKAHSLARLQGNFFNVAAEGKAVKNPLELGLQWMVDFSKDSFIGADKILGDRSRGVARALAAVDSETPLSVGAKLYFGGRAVGEIVVAEEISGRGLALGLFERDFAYAGFDYSLSPNGGDDVRTVSRPTVLSRSLTEGMGAE